MPTIYDTNFYAAQASGSLDAARVVMPIVLNAFPSRTIIDVGCGLGTWLLASKEAGASRIEGYDGEYVDRENLLIDGEEFHAVDLSSSFELATQADLVISLEVAEHLPSESSQAFVECLTAGAPVVLFSAAVPGQGGTDHVNERWQDYWRNLFMGRGYRAVDLVRPLIRGNPLVPWWYQQNIIIYCNEHSLSLQSVQPVPDNVSLNYVHQTLYELALARSNMHLSRALRMIPRLAVRAISNRLGKIV